MYILGFIYLYIDQNSINKLIKENIVNKISMKKSVTIKDKILKEYEDKYKQIILYKKLKS